MQIAANKSRLITALSLNAGLAGTERLIGRKGLLQQIFLERLTGIANSQQAFIKIANHLIHVAEHAYSFRDADTIEEAGAVLMNLPVENLRQAGLYYHALTLKRKGHREEAETLLEAIADRAPLAYRARAIQTLGANSREKGQLDEALRFQFEALQITSDKNAHSLLITLFAHYQISHIRSDIGDHQGSLAILESLWPLVRVVSKQSPLYFYLYHNELAVELAESGRLDEAQSACEVALASPYAHAYPEWSETREEIAAKRQSASPSVIAITRVNAGTSTQAQTRRVRASGWPAVENVFSLSSITIAIDVSASIALACLIRTILDRLGESIRPRAPPRLS